MDARIYTQHVIVTEQDKRIVLALEAGQCLLSLFGNTGDDPSPACIVELRPGNYPNGGIGEVIVRIDPSRLNISA